MGSMNTELYLDIDTGEGAPARLAAALAAGPVAAVLIHAAAGPRTDANVVRTLIETAQRHGAAALLQDDLHRVCLAPADGLHLASSADIEARYAEARRTLGPRLIIGCMAGASRHDAMTLGEAGADYIGFGGAGISVAERAELIGWWAELFEVPCVAFGVTEPSEALALADAGADFIGVPTDAGLPPAAAGERVRDILAALRAGEQPKHVAGGRR
jgi:thiamine-phosphate pyrophosphorylase